MVSGVGAGLQSCLSRTQAANSSPSLESATPTTCSSINNIFVHRKFNYLDLCDVWVGVQKLLNLSG